MCPLWPLHYIIIYAMAFIPLWLACFGSVAAALNSSVKFLPSKVDKLSSGNTSEVTVVFSDLDPGEYRYTLLPEARQHQITVSPREIVFNLNGSTASTLKRSFKLTAHNLGYAAVRIAGGRLPHKNVSESGGGVVSSWSLPVSVVRDASSRRLDTVFGICVAVLMGLTYINMGCTLDLQVIRDTVVRPVGPAIGLVCQYIIMPLAGFGLSLATLSDPGMRLGLFLTGCSPGGGASNLWTYLLNGNINLSVTMTLISSMVAFAAVPAWVYCLGRGLVSDPDIVIPYSRILTLLVTLVVPCLIGILIKRYLPKVANVLRIMLKPWSVALFIFIITFGIYCNQHLIHFVTWRLMLGGAALPLLGFTGGAMAAWATGRSLEDAIAISVETGVQNTGVSIFMLKFSLDEPANDIAILAPIAVATMTPWPLFIAMLVRRLCSHCRSGVLPVKHPQNGINKLRADDSVSLDGMAQINALQP